MLNVKVGKSQNHAFLPSILRKNKRKHLSNSALVFKMGDKIEKERTFISLIWRILDPYGGRHRQKKFVCFLEPRKMAFEIFWPLNNIFHKLRTVRVKIVVKNIHILSIPFMLLTKLSTAMTLKSSCNNCKMQWLPMYPPPPVTKMFLPVPGIMLYWKWKKKSQ